MRLHSLGPGIFSIVDIHAGIRRAADLGQIVAEAIAVRVVHDFRFGEFPRYGWRIGAQVKGNGFGPISTGLAGRQDTAFDWRPVGVIDAAGDLVIGDAGVPYLFGRIGRHYRGAQRDQEQGDDCVEMFHLIPTLFCS